MNSCWDQYTGSGRAVTGGCGALVGSWNGNAELFPPAGAGVTEGMAAGHWFAGVVGPSGGGVGGNGD